MTEQEVLHYVKRKLNTYITGIELSDDEILDHIKTVVLPEFSEYVPDSTGLLPLDTTDPTVQTTNPNVYKLIDPENRRIYSINDVVFTDQHLIFGHPIMGVWHYDQLPNWMLAVEKSRDAHLYSNLNFNWDFIPPNLLRITPIYTDICTILYDREHASDFSTVPMAYSSYFLKWCIGSIMESVGISRTRFGSVSTPFGDINLNGDAMVSDGREMISNVKEELNVATVPWIEMDFG